MDIKPTQNRNRNTNTDTTKCHIHQDNQLRQNSHRPQQHPTIHIGQINAQNSIAALDELRQVINIDKIDIVLIQEPYSRNNVISSLGINTRVVTDTKRFTNIASSDKIKTAIAVTNPSYTVLKIEQLSNTHCVCAEVSVGTYKLYVVSAYFQYSDKIEPYIQHIERVLLTLKGHSVIVCADANAKSTLWHSGQTDERGELLENLIAQQNLFIHNKDSDAYTFESLSGTANIDVTLSTSRIYNKISHWTIHRDKTTSDHNLITFKINTPESANDGTLATGTRYNISRANWKKFQRYLREQYENASTEERRNTPDDPEEQAAELQHLLRSACDTAVPRKTKHRKSVPWWNADLTTLKAEVSKARRQYQSETNTNRKEHRRNQYRAIRNRYIAKIRKAKSDSWRNFVTTEGNAEPWSMIYKLQTNKIHIEQAQETIRNANRQTTTLADTAKVLLDTLIPDDNQTGETPWHTKIRNEVKTPPDTEDTPPFETQEIDKIIRKLKNKKAPGHDLIETEVIKAAWPILGEEITALMNNCLRQGCFPQDWKRGVIRVLLKGEGKDKTDPKSYRPICLLPVLSKILEKLISQRLEELFHHHPLSSKKQFGFKKGHSTEDAIVRLRDVANTINEKYAVAMLFDISGAFDGVWWPGLLYNLKKRNCPRNLYRLIQSYLRDRIMCISSNNTDVMKTATKGCPQGSILGPNFWNLNFDDILNTIEQAGYEAIAYADDILVVVTGNSRKEIEIKANQLTNLLTEWCTKHKLQLSKTKSEMLLIKGFLDIKRPPTVKIEQKSLKMTSAARYLGVHLGTRLNITPHVHHITDRTKQVFNKLAHVARAHWGINFRNMLTLYKGVFVPMITYAAAGWMDRINTWHRKKLIQAQRHALLRVTRAYRTVSTDALVVVAGVVPIDLLLKERAAAYNLKKNRPFKLGDLTFEPQDIIPNAEQLNTIAKQIETQTTNTWQINWQQSTKGRITYKFFNDVTSRMTAHWINTTYYSTQLLTGHGQIRDMQKARNIAADDLCECKKKDSVEHIIFECVKLQQFRDRLKQNLAAEGVTWPCQLHELTKANTYAYLAAFASEVMKYREQIEWEQRQETAQEARRQTRDRRNPTRLTNTNRT